MSVIHIVFGPLGAGKTTYAHDLSSNENAICFSIDSWMVDFFGADAPVPLTMQWAMERVKRCENRIWLTARDVAKSGSNVVLDLGFLKKASRKEFLDLASREGLEIKSHFIHAQRNTRRLRVLARNETKGDTFALAVSPEMFDFMDAQFETATQLELSTAIVVDTETHA